MRIPLFRMNHKRDRIISFALMAVVTFALTACASVKKLEEQRQIVAEAIAKRQVRIDITSMNTMRYGGRSVTGDFFLELKNDTLHSYLPYLGQAYKSSYVSPSIGLNFEKPIQNYIESHTKKNRTQLHLDVRTEEDSYHYTIEIYDTGEAYIHVKSQFRDPISFTGSMKMPDI